MLISRILIISLLCLTIPEENVKDKTLFISPVKIPLALSANFGELRVDHFHSGIDIKTQGVIGKEIVAAASGYVYRVSVSPGGFGKALYVRHPSGYSTVYGHLDRFIPEIEEYVINQQYEKKSFLINLYPPRDRFTFNQGDLIAFSGNTGSSSGPHLHYEIRKTDNEVPVNPLLFEYGTGDNINPVIERLVIYPINRNTAINGKNSIRRLNVSGGHGNYYIPAENGISISGQAGFGIKAYDLLNDSYNKCAVYSIELKIDSTTIFNYVMDEFSFSESRYINSHIDYETYIRERTYIERAFILPNDKLSVYKSSVNRGIFDFSEDRIYDIEFILSDVHNNKSVLGFKVKGGGQKATSLKSAQEEPFTLMPYSRSNRFRAEGVSVSIPAGALYDTLFFRYKRDRGTPEMLSDVHCVHNRFTPLQRAFTLSIKPSKIPAGKESKLLIAQMSDDFRKSALTSSFNDGFVTTDVLSFGMFFVSIDTIPPVISANGLTPGANLSGRKEIRIRITDDFSGIKSYEPMIDGKWALFEYDQKNSVIIYRFDPKRITKGSNHNLSLKVTDNKDNISYYSCNFVW
jgi:hypothetical protein